MTTDADSREFLNELRHAYYLLIAGTASEVLVKHPVRDYMLRSSDVGVIADALRRLEFQHDPREALACEIAVANSEARTDVEADALIARLGGDAREAVKALLVLVSPSSNVHE